MRGRLYNSSWLEAWLLAIGFCCLITPAVMVKHENFKTCDQSGFCKRNRQYADTAAARGSSWTSPYRIDSRTLQVNEGKVTATILKSIEGHSSVELPLTLTFLRSGSVRIRVDERKRQTGEIELRHGSQARKERYSGAGDWALVGDLVPAEITVASSDDEGLTIQYGRETNCKAHIRYMPFSIDFMRNDTTHIRVNAKGLMNMEHWRPKSDKQVTEPVESEEAQVPVIKENAIDESTWWEEVFGGNTDSKPRGPESVALDITFPSYEHVFGIPEHAGPLSLKETRGGYGNYDQPYRMYNADVFEYEMDSPMTLYGSIPFMQAHRTDSTVGVFWLNAAETWVDIVKTKGSSNPLSLGIGAKTDTHTHWFSESGVIDLFVFLGPTPKEVLQSYTELTGPSQLPQQFAIAYHQCRWNYVTDEDVKDVDRKFDRFNIPYDVIWLDIEYTDGKKYFTWDPHTFPDPIAMGKQLDSHRRKLVTIIDPHIKNEGGYSVVDALKSKSLAVNNKDNNLYEGWCWPGSSHWIDCFNPAAIKWWQELFRYSAFPGTASNTFIWNDMNEPSVFNGPETTMPKDNLHHGNWEHRDVHNLNGLTFVNATYNALLHRDSKSPRRPFVLTRAFFAGSQRMGATWTGDNQASWDHLAASIPMILANNIAGFPFVGADVGGFFGNPSKELLTRWYQAGTFYPFFRGHAHIDTRRREPYLAGEPYTQIITQAIRLRYQLLPAWYTAFHEAATDGSPIVRPHYYVHAWDEKGFAVDDQFYIGSTGLLAKPVTTEGAESVDFYIPDEEKYYDYFDYTVVHGKGKTHKFHAPLDKIPLLMQGGHIIPRKDRPRRSSGLMKFDPYTLVVVPDNNGNAVGTVYVDDGESFDYQDGAYIHRQFSFDLTSQSLVSQAMGQTGKRSKEYHKTMATVRIEKIVIVGAPAEWKSRTEVLAMEEGAKQGRTVPLSWHAGEPGKAAWAVVRDPGLTIGARWKIDFS
ncbi:hypothetical protein MMC26_007524 [Xylographa opegraphella]|nr:hypothetical protein [Xylographa opegraphella]